MTKKKLKKSIPISTSGGGSVLSDGTVITEGDRTFIIRWRPVSTLKGLPGKAMVEKMKDGQSLTLPNGIRFYKNDYGCLFRILKADVTLQKKTDDYKPMDLEQTAKTVTKNSHTASRRASNLSKLVASVVTEAGPAVVAKRLKKLVKEQFSAPNVRQENLGE